VSTKEANYSLHAEVVGEHNVSAIASNENGTDMQSWVWNVTVTPVLNCTCGDICVNETGWWRDGGSFIASGTPIQDAIDNATAGDIICVKDGTYNENVVVTKSHLTIRSEKGPSGTTVSASLYPDDHVFDISDQTNVTLQGFEIRDAHGTSQSVAGIYMDNASECNISGNIVTNISATGIYDYACGIWLEDSSDNSLSSNTADSNNDYGILLSHSSDNSLSSNTADSNNKYGISLSHSSNNTLIGNNASKNHRDGIYLYYSDNNTLIGNNASKNHRDGIYLYYSDNNKLTGNNASKNDCFGIYLSNSNNNTLTNNTASNSSSLGILLGFSSGNTLTGNNASNNNYGISVRNSYNNTFTDNTASNNRIGGISVLWHSSGNTFTDNTASNNTLWWDFYSDESSHDNTIEDLTIASYPTTISFTYANGVGLKGVETAPGDPAGKANVGKYVNATNVTANSWIFLNVSYSDADLGGVDEDSLRMCRYNGTDWTEVPAPNGVNTIENYVYANITSFSIFAPLGNVTGAKLEINKTGVPDPVSPGGTLNYTIAVNNTGNATATNVTVMETYDENVTFVAAVPAPAPGNDTWQFQTLNVSETRWINISVIVNASVLNGTVLHNIVNVTCDEGVTDSDTENTTVFVAPVLNCTCGDICVNTTGWWRDGSAFIASGTPIQAAINNATAGETICVKDGTYNENVDVTKSDLTIRSENGPYVTTVSASLNPDDHVFDITDKTNVTLEGFEIRDAHGTSQDVAGIYMDNARECNISNNIVTNISATGNNYAYGIRLYYSSGNSFDTTTVYNLSSVDSAACIYMDYSSDNSFDTTTVYNLSANDEALGIGLYSSSGNSFDTSTVYNLSANAAACIWLGSSSGNSFDTSTVYNLSASRAYGIYMSSSSDNSFDTSTVYNLDANDEALGILLRSSSDNNSFDTSTVYKSRCKRRRRHLSVFFKRQLVRHNHHRLQSRCKPQRLRHLSVFFKRQLV
jgi:uncharacterized repeat protein (TIGR01451 family)